jgi:hypothetical protein
MLDVSTDFIAKIAPGKPHRKDRPVKDRMSKEKDSNWDGVGMQLYSNALAQFVSWESIINQRETGYYTEANRDWNLRIDFKGKSLLFRLSPFEALPYLIYPLQRYNVLLPRV